MSLRLRSVTGAFLIWEIFQLPVALLMSIKVYNKDTNKGEAIHNKGDFTMKIKRMATVFLLLAFCLFWLAPAALAAGTENGEKRELRVLFTHDLHSYILPYDVADGLDGRTTMGGYARLATLIKENLTDNTVVLDAGDFSMGTLFNSIFKTHAPDLCLMGEMGFDATTIGNHEFDYGADGLAAALRSASKAQNRPAMLNSNMVFGDEPKSEEIKAAFDAYGSSATKIIERGGLKIGVFGMLSQVAQDYTVNYAPLSFADTIETANACVDSLKAQNADVIICLSHGGTNPDIEKSEDQQLAKAVPDIDVIVSGHTHTTLDTPITEGRTTIVGCGWRGEQLGLLDLKLEADNTVKVDSYQLIENSRDVAMDPDIAASINPYKDVVQQEFLTPLGKSFDATAAVSDHNFATVDDLLGRFGNSDLGDIITDAYRYGAAQNGVDADISLVNAGLVRDTIYKGNLSESGVYNILSLGSGSDGSVGYPLVDFYLYGSELKTLCQIDVSMYPMMQEVQFSFSVLRYTYNDSRLPLDKVTGVETQNADGTWTPLDEDRLYRVTTSQYLANMTGLMTKMSHGIITLAPRDKDGNPVSDTNTLIIHTPTGAEAKEWIALSDYIHSFPVGESGLRTIPASYNIAREVKTPVDNTLVTFFANPSSIALAVYGIIAGLIVLLIIIILLIRRHHIRKHRV